MSARALRSGVVGASAVYPCRLKPVAGVARARGGSAEERQTGRNPRGSGTLLRTRGARPRLRGAYGMLPVSRALLISA